MHGTLAFSAAVMLAVLLAACDLGVPGCLGGGGGLTFAAFAFAFAAAAKMIYLCGPILGNDPILWLQTMSC